MAAGIVRGMAGAMFGMMVQPTVQIIGQQLQRIMPGVDPSVAQLAGAAVSPGRLERAEERLGNAAAPPQQTATPTGWHMLGG